MKLSTASEILNVDTQRVGDARKHQHGRIAAAALDAAEIGLMHRSPMSEFLLREPPLAPQRLHVKPDSDPNIHARMARSDLTSDHRL